jgi:hypothetical protein
VERHHKRSNLHTTQAKDQVKGKRLTLKVLCCPHKDKEESLEQEAQVTGVGEYVDKWNPHTLLEGCKMTQPTKLQNGKKFPDSSLS